MGRGRGGGGGEEEAAKKKEQFCQFFSFSLVKQEDDGESEWMEKHQTHNGPPRRRRGAGECSILS